MKKTFTLLFGFIFLNLSFAQNAEELNNQSKELLSKRDYEKALPLLRKAAELGNAEAQYNLGYFLQNGVGIDKNEIEAFQWYKKSSENGFNDGHYAMMMAYGNGIGTEINNEKAFEYALKCAENNDATCMWNIVNCYKQGLGVTKNSSKMLEWATKLALLENPENLNLSGNITSMRLSLAQMYRDGDSIEKDNYKSYLWYLIFNEFKKDFSISQQQQIIEEIKLAETKLSENQLKSSKQDAEKIFKRKLNNFENLYKADF
ncbi:sel1 repeat family protein [Flavobacterium sp. J49]|uniref:tetratricopeptide repeat protein n=1 Tax=Flavobacterium sp. J49 TaxID=2718534 RepID=UPI001593DAB4|nr:tetratricopeptide repeat protein [Flavobacterium sp. J49]MBF6640238.1 sel1 repeat family protein [Flavobacterium sp. J49]NIC01483.1 sel1 repeat family protein [Flavobacterium sp. J49]